MRHNCIFHGFTLVNKSIFADYDPKHARYSEEVREFMSTHKEQPILAETETIVAHRDGCSCS
jgi:hypothetical protein